MPSDATTIQLRDGGVAVEQPPRRGSPGSALRAFAATDIRTKLAAAALIAIVALSLLIVVIAADRPSLLELVPQPNRFSSRQTRPFARWNWSPAQRPRLSTGSPSPPVRAGSNRPVDR